MFSRSNQETKCRDNASNNSASQSSQHESWMPEDAQHQANKGDNNQFTHGYKFSFAI
jgi:hypothetical protein